MSRTYKDKPKNWYEGNVPSWFKRINRREERAKEKMAVRMRGEVPIFKKRDAYEYW